MSKKTNKIKISLTQIQSLDHDFDTFIFLTSIVFRILMMVLWWHDDNKRGKAKKHYNKQVNYKSNYIFACLRLPGVLLLVYNIIE